MQVDSRGSHRPLVVHVHATEFDRCGENVNQAIYDIERFGMHRACRIIAVSQRTKDMIVSRYGIPMEKVEVVHNGVLKETSIGREEAGKSLQEKIVLFLGRITQQKGPEYFLETARLVLQKMDSVRFVMVGAGDMLPRMMENMAYHRMLSHFHFTGFLQGEKRERIFAMSDLYIMPSVSEPFGLTPVEAMLYDVPVIVSKQSGVAEVLPSAIQVDFWDTKKLATTIIDVLTNPSLSKRLIEEGKRDLDRIDWDIAADKVIGVYHASIQ